MKIFKTFLNERGMILVISLLILALLLGAGVGAIVSMQTDFRTSSNLKTGAQALYIADAGVNHARQELQDSDQPNFDCIFANSCGPGIVSNSSFNGGTYTVTRTGTSGTNLVKATSVGTAPNNARAEIEVWFRKDDGRPPKAVESNGDLRLSGNPTIMGACGGAHANEDMRIDGAPKAQMANGLTVSNQTVTNRGLDIANGFQIDGNSACVGSAACDNPPGQQPDANKLDTATKKDTYIATNNTAELADIPKINAAEYAQHVASLGAAGNGYICRQSGQVQQGGTCDAATGLCSGGTVVSAPSGWSCTGGGWEVTGNSAANGVFYSEGQTRISGSPGTSSNPLQATIISRDSINISGSPQMKPYPTTDDALKNHLLVTGNDLEISGNAGMNYTNAAILVHQQFKISGSPEIAGFIMSNDGLPTWTGDPFPPSVSSSGVTINEIPGNPRITYACDFGCTGPGCPPPTVATASWAQQF